MGLLITFALTLVVAVLISGFAEKTVLSIAVLFLASGLLLGSGVFGTVQEVNPHLLERIAELALFSVLFTDGMKTGGIQQLRTFWHLPSRVLVIGMPLTIGAIAILAHYMTSLDWPHALLMGAALSPTDPVFISAIFRFKAVPEVVKRLLNVESGLNDGLALLPVMLLLAYVGVRGSSLAHMIEEMALGIIIGFAIPWIGIRLEKTRLFHASGLFHPLNAFALGLLVLAMCYMTGANLFLGAFAAGVTLTTFGPSFTESFREFGELVTELLKLSALLVFGAVMAPQLFTPLPGAQYGFIILAVFAVRPLMVGVSLIRSGLTRQESLLAGWFGPKGFASVVYGLLIYQGGLTHMGHLIGLAAAASIVVYSSTDIWIGRWFEKRHAPKEPQGDNSQTGWPNKTQSSTRDRAA